MEITLKNIPTLADTHLNLCAVLSQLNKHEEAIEHALLAIVMLQDEFLQFTMKFFQMYKNNQNLNQYSQKSLSEERMAVLAIAYHNLGVEFEHLKRFDESLKIYKKALNFAKENLGENHHLVINLTKVVASAEKENQDPQRVIKKIRKQKKIQSLETQHKDNVNLPKISNRNVDRVSTHIGKNYQSEGQYKIRTDSLHQNLPYKLDEFQNETSKSKNLRLKNQNSFRQHYQPKQNMNQSYNYQPQNLQDNYSLQQNASLRAKKSQKVNQSYDFNRPLQIQDSGSNIEYISHSTKNQKNNSYNNQYAELLTVGDNKIETVNETQKIQLQPLEQYEDSMDER